MGGYQQMIPAGSQAIGAEPKSCCQISAQQGNEGAKEQLEPGAGRKEPDLSCAWKNLHQLPHLDCSVWLQGPWVKSMIN